jgi:hypothetical protein
MLEFNVTGNLGKDPRLAGNVVRATLCVNTPINKTINTEPVWIDIEAPAGCKIADRLLEMYRGDGVLVRGVVRINYYQHAGESKQGWTLAINQLNLIHKS